MVPCTTGWLPPTSMPTKRDSVNTAFSKYSPIGFSRNTLPTAVFRIWAWGSNASGELGDGTTVDRPSPVQVIGLDQVSAVAANGGPYGSHSLALRSDRLCLRRITSRSR